MLAILIIILVLLGAAVVGSIYSNFLVFHSNFSESENYHKAYYTSISALERGELVTKQRQPGYQGSGGFILGVGTGSFSGSDKSLSGFSYLDNETGSSVFRTINSRTKRIPAEKKGDVERMLAYNNPSNPDDLNNSNNYNMMDYENAEIFLLYYDESKNNPYTGGKILQSIPSQIQGEIRLPKLLYNSGFGDLDTTTSSVGLSGSLPTNDAIVDRQIRGNLNEGYGIFPFTIYSTQSLIIGGSKTTVKSNEDSVFREADINTPLTFKFGNYGRSPLARSPRARPTIISEKEDFILSLDNYFYLFTMTPEKTQLRFSLLNLLGTGQKVYPFLEYYVQFGGADVPDKYFTINGEGNYKDYQVNTIIQKPTTKESILGNFTSIF